MKFGFKYLVIILLSINCGSSSNSLNIAPIKSHLSGENLGKMIRNRQVIIKERNINTTIFNIHKDSIIEEIDIYVSSKPDSSYLKILKFYNSKFNTNYLDTILNTWQTDSSEFILYKNTDSSILVNIFKR